MRGLVTYLAGPGRRNEHADQHVVAGDEWTELRFMDAGLDGQAIADLAGHLDSGQSATGKPMKGGHVWHCSLAIGKPDGILSDEEWNRIAHEFIRKMGFDDAEGTKAPCMWTAIRHGLSGADGDGNDHIHIAVNLVRTDGTKAWIHNDYRRAQQACRELEQEHGLEELATGKTKAATRGWQPGEREAQARRRARAKLYRESPSVSWGSLPVEERKRLTAAEMQEDQPRHRLATQIRAAAATSRTEAEFIRRLRGQGILIRPRYARGTTRVVTGYSVAERPVWGEKPVWYGGGTLARDLRLPRLRDGWTDSPAASAEAAAEWSAALRNRRVVHPRQGEQAPRPEAVAQEMATLNDRLRSIDPADRETWAHVAHETAGALSSWSRSIEPQPGPIAEAAREISRSAQTYAKPPRPPHLVRTTMVDAALAFSASLDGADSRKMQAVMYRQLFKTVVAIQQAMQARKDAYLARITLEQERGNLMTVARTLPAVTAPPKKPATTQDPVTALVQAGRQAPATTTGARGINKDPNTRKRTRTAGRAQGKEHY